MPRVRRNGTIIPDRGGHRQGSGRLQTRVRLATKHGHMLRDIAHYYPALEWERQTAEGDGLTYVDAIVRALIERAHSEACEAYNAQTWVWRKAGTEERPFIIE